MVSSDTSNLLLSPSVRETTREGRDSAQGATSAQRGCRLGREAPLVLIEEHLTDKSEESQYRHALQGGVAVKNWFVDRSFSCKPNPLVLKIQSFDSGGAECTVRRIDLEKIGAAMERDVRRGKREAPDVISEDCVARAGQRAKRRVRLLVKNMGATNLVTLNLREGPNTKDWSNEKFEWWEAEGKDAWFKSVSPFKDADWWARSWDKLRRMLERVIGKFPYVAVLEEHRKGNFHLHVAWVGKVNLNVMRGAWWAICGGRGAGNVDSKYIKVARTCNRTTVIARYISKYVSKHFESAANYRFNKKRYWASRQDMPEVRRYILAQDSVGDVLDALKPWLEIRVDDRHNFFMFPDIDGFWWNYIPSASAGPPF